jgi:leucyl/phenylalanyl-tRNA--protein transferase
MAATSPLPNLLNPQLLVRAYATGIFPMSESRHDPSVFWVDPQVRGILPLDTFHVSCSLKKKIRKHYFSVEFNIDFPAVIEACAETPRPGQGTWINNQIIDAYTELYTLGIAHSVECRLDGKLVGGLYGVSLNGVFCGESMFSHETDASKVALVHLVARLKYCKMQLLDTQFVTDHLKKFGAIEIPARDYLMRLNHAMKSKAKFQLDVSGEDSWSSVESLLKQSSSQTS